jgi:hypothetical protein
MCEEWAKNEGLKVSRKDFIEWLKRKKIYKERIRIDKKVSSGFEGFSPKPEEDEVSSLKPDESSPL